MENNTLKTGIDGLDVVLNCKDKGLVLNKDNNLLIVLRGDRGISKLDLAMKMMEGISLSTPEQSEKLSPPRFYTLNKDWKELRGRSSQSMKNRYKIEEVIPEIMTEGEDKERRKTSYLSSRLVHFNVILQKIKDINEKSSCIVIYGFGGLNANEFNRLPMDKLEILLRQKAQIAILIFDNRLLDYNTNADMIIEMKRSLYPVHNYTYFELQISKSILQTVSHGWHRYKHLANGSIEVYPSIHKILSDIKPLRDQVSNLKKGVQNYKPEDLGGNTHDINRLGNVLYPKSGKVTSIIGASNTFKRYLTAVAISQALQKKKRCLVVLFNEDNQGFLNILDKVDKTALSNTNLQFLDLPMGCISSGEFINIIQQYIYDFTKDCCDKRVSLFMLDLAEMDYSFPILKDETLFLPALVAVCKNNRNESHNPNVSLHLVCNKHFSLIDTVVSVSDDVLCTSRENVYIQRQEGEKEINIKDTDANKEKDSKIALPLTICLEKNSFGAEHNSRVYKYYIEDILSATKDSILDLNRAEEIFSNKEFWRKSINVKNILKVNKES